MNTTIAEVEPVAIKAWTEKRMVFLELTDGRVFGFPADRFQILSQASEAQLKEVKLVGRTRRRPDGGGGSCWKISTSTTKTSSLTAWSGCQ